MITYLQGHWVEQLRTLPDCSVHCVVCSPPYWGLRRYIDDNAPEKKFELGLEKTPEEYVAKVVAGFREVRRVLRDDGTCWVNLGDTYNSGTSADRSAAGMDASDVGYWMHAGRMGDKRVNHPGLKPKDLCMMPARVALALQADGWYLRAEIIWSKSNPMPESVTDRPTKAHEQIYLLTKQPRYFYDAEAIKEPVTGDAHMRKANGPNSRMVHERAVGRENSKPNPSRSNIPGVTPKSQPAGSGVKANESFHAACVDLVGSRNKRSVWTVPSAPYSEAHFATFPPDLIKPCILAGTSARGCCPKCGAPWGRITEKPSTGKQDYNGKHSHADPSSAGRNILASVRAAREAGGEHDNPFPSAVTTGWKPTCDCCEAQTVPCTVLDPFGGSGTSGLVAMELGRRAIMIELNPKYVLLAKRRCDVTPGLPLA